MTSKGVVLPLLRRELRPTSSLRIPSFASSLSTVAAHPNRGHSVRNNSSANLSYLAKRRIEGRSRRGGVVSQTQSQIRAFSQSSSRMFTDEDGNFDPTQVERESDEVDVCIVGGGMVFFKCAYIICYADANVFFFFFFFPQN